ncbi:MAG: dTMP kinase [Thermoproteota archaeon]|nr:dTMP kinase [Thermoproteota archaeon]
MKEKTKGKLIVIEGLDKSGKTTQSKLLFDFYNKIYPAQVSLLNFPDYTTTIGKEIRSFLQGQVAYNNEVKHILLSANRWEKKPEIESLVEQNKIIILNRYYQSNLVYGLANGMNFDWLVNLDKGLPKEDIVIVLDTNPDITYKRGIDNDFFLDEFEKNKNFLEKARNNYLDLAKKFNWIVINSDSDIHSIHKSIVNIIKVDK